MNGLKALGVGLAIVGLAIAVPVAAVALVATEGHENQGVTVKVTMPDTSSMGMRAGTAGVMASPSQTSAVADQLTIVHMQKGCHDWSNGTTQTATMRLAMKRGQMLRIMNQDVDLHRLMQLSGPAMMTGGPMKEGQAHSLTFTRPGTYRFDTKASPMKGMPEVQTIGPDNMLRLTVTVR